MPGKVRGSTSPGDQHLDSAGFRAGREFGHPHRRAMRRDNVLFIRNAEALQHIDGMLHRLPIGGRTHDDGH
jgi:hypothetical protein